METTCSESYAQGGLAIVSHCVIDLRSRAISHAETAEGAAASDGSGSKPLKLDQLESMGHAGMARKAAGTLAHMTVCGSHHDLGNGWGDLNNFSLTVTAMKRAGPVIGPLLPLVRSSWVALSWKACMDAAKKEKQTQALVSLCKDHSAQRPEETAASKGPEKLIQGCRQKAASSNKAKGSIAPLPPCDNKCKKCLQSSSASPFARFAHIISIRHERVALPAKGSGGA